MTDDLQPMRDKKARRDAGQAILTAIGSDLSVEQVAELTETAPDAVGQALAEAVERARAYREFDLIRAARLEERTGIKPDECWNAVCRDFVEIEHVRGRDKAGEFEISKPGSYPRCGKRDNAMGCIFRMQEQPPSDPFADIPSHAEAVRMLQRAGLLKPDEFGKWNGTDFAFRGAVSKLWWAFVRLLVDTGKIPAAMFTCDDGEQVPDMGARVDAALDYAGFERRRT